MQTAPLQRSAVEVRKTESGFWRDVRSRELNFFFFFFFNEVIWPCLKANRKDVMEQ